MNIGEKIRNLRVKNKLTQKELADKINKSTITIRKYESQSIVPPIDVINQLSNLFNISPSYLVDDTKNITDINNTLYLNDTFINNLFNHNSDELILNDSDKFSNIPEEIKFKLENIKKTKQIFNDLNISLSVINKNNSYFIQLKNDNNKTLYELSLEQFELLYKRILWNTKNELDFINFIK
ncbi:helix-turn-helix domain-containing protein [Terrisporobacter hibernicus]|uniref:Helix-turn-helix domain-containing protein n=1 Tax=Terrisporobacter hibernicus TaxID=2813371 RepID=A0AAX2ZKW9_9FIRM|nr:helix-turn-helix transcriptional regulator [Terrisporobacter hibernicus]UEL49190.1 helix-turn-helix domain-containing protein [Terrisporobacter hibernicus]